MRRDKSSSHFADYGWGGGGNHVSDFCGRCLLGEGKAEKNFQAGVRSIFSREIFTSFTTSFKNNYNLVEF